VEPQTKGAAQGTKRPPPHASKSPKTPEVTVQMPCFLRAMLTPGTTTPLRAAGLPTRRTPTLSHRPEAIAARWVRTRRLMPSSSPAPSVQDPYQTEPGGGCQVIRGRQSCEVGTRLTYDAAAGSAAASRIGASKVRRGGLVNWSRHHTPGIPKKSSTAECPAPVSISAYGGGGLRASLGYTTQVS